MHYRVAFAVLAVPAVITYSFLVVARLLYPKPEDLEGEVSQVQSTRLPRVFWLYLGGAALVAAGFADFQLIAYHFQKADSVQILWIPITYSIAMGVSGLGSLVFGRMLDRRGIRILVPLTIVSAAFAPLVFLGGFWPVIVGSALWGLGMVVHESIVPAAVATMVPPQRRPVGVRVVHGSLRRRVVSWKRADGDSLRPLSQRRRHLLRRPAACRNPHLRPSGAGVPNRPHHSLPPDVA